ncbi:DUF4013 domain-containing protein [Candidatus Woesearchaeota archaeon]|nr:DUF4013 domain-containing protein [Candidatus Woesearchaeota archaeon]
MAGFLSSVKEPFTDWRRLGVLLLISLFPVVLVSALQVAFVPEYAGASSYDRAGVAEVPDIGLKLDLIELVAAPVSILANLVVMGYCLKCAKGAMSGKFILPEWRSFGRLVWDGLRSLVVILAYLVPLVVFVFGVLVLVGTVLGVIAGGSFSMGILAAADAVWGFSGRVAAVLVIAAIILPAVAVFLLFCPMALMAFAEHDRFGAAFRLREVFGRAFRWVVAGYLLLLFGYFVLVGIGFALFVALLFFAGIPGNAELFAESVFSGAAGAVLSVTAYAAYGAVYRRRA